MSALDDKDRERLEILSMEVGSMLTACNSIIKVVSAMVVELHGIVKKIENGRFYNQLQSDEKDDERSEVTDS